MKLLRTVALCLLAISPAVGSAAGEVVIVSPDSQTPVFDEVEVVVEISDEKIVDHVEISVDGKIAEVLRAFPYRLSVDVGGENRAHEFSVRVVYADDSQDTHRVVTPAVAIDLEVDLSLAQLYVTASQGGVPVLDLEGEDFEIFDNGERQELVTFERGDTPMTLAFLVDASESMTGGYLQGAIEAARGFVSRLNPLDEATLLIFSDRLHHLTGPSVESAGIAEALNDLESGGGTALNDYLYSALRILDGRHGRPVVILLSDGVDTLSFLRMQDVLWKVRRTDAVIYRVQVQESASRGLGYATVWRNMREQKREVDGLDQAVAESGGRVKILQGIDALPAALDEILLELRQQYVLGYYSTATAEQDRFRPVRVRVDRPDVDVRTRSGHVN